MSKSKKMLLCVFVVFLVSTILGVLLNMLTGANEIYTFAWKRLFPSSAMAAYALFLYSRDFIDSAHQMGTRKLITAAAIGGSLMVGLNLLFGLLRAKIGGDLLTQNQEALNAAAATLPIVAFFVSVFCAPIVEETIFRFILQGWLRERIKRGGAPISVIIAGTLFALLHTGTPVDLIQYLPVGLLLGAIYEKTQCISLLICIHSFNNLIAFALQNM